MRAAHGTDLPPDPSQHSAAAGSLSRSRSRGQGRRGILCVHSSNEMYGADRVVLQVLQAVPQERRADVRVWLPGTGPTPATGRLSDELQRRGVAYRERAVPVLRRRLMSLRGVLILLGQVAAVLPGLIRLRPEVVYCSTSAVLLLAPISRALGVPRVVVHVQEIWSGPESAVLRLLARFATDWVAISQASAASLPKSLQRRVLVISNGVEDPATPLRQSGHGEDRPLHFVMAGRWNAWKGHRTLLEAWNNGPPPGMLTILGGTPPTGAATDVRALVAALAFPDSVRVVGEVGDIGPYVDTADIMVVPSDAPEPFGLVAIESFARSTPVIGSNAGGLAEVVTQGVTGWLFEPGNPVELARILRRVDRSEVQAMGQRARRSFEEQYTGEVFRENLASWWKRVLDS